MRFWALAARPGGQVRHLLTSFVPQLTEVRALNKKYPSWKQHHLSLKERWAQARSNDQAFIAASVANSGGGEEAQNSSHIVRGDASLTAPRQRSAGRRSRRSTLAVAADLMATKRRRISSKTGDLQGCYKRVPQS